MSIEQYGPVGRERSRNDFQSDYRSHPLTRKFADEWIFIRHVPACRQTSDLLVSGIRHSRSLSTLRSALCLGSPRLSRNFVVMVSKFCTNALFLLVHVLVADIWDAVAQ